MRRFRMIPVASVLACCLACIFPSRAMAKITDQWVSCPEGKITKMGNGVGCVMPLPVRPPGGGVGSNPNDWGMCGVLGLSATFSPATVARIMVDKSGYYAVELIGATAKETPTLAVTCVLFSDFTGVPPPSDATYFAPHSYNGGGGDSSEIITGSAGNACIWAGLSGDLTADTNEGASGDAYAKFYTPTTLMGSLYVTTYAFCSGYKAASWHGWKYLNRAGGGYSMPDGVAVLGANQAQQWCYMDRVSVWDIPSPAPIYAVINIVSPSGAYFMSTSPANVWLGYNCLRRKQ
jgi:hypothetical protein